MSLSRDIKFQVNIYAVRVVETRFTFYKTVATLEYIKETSKNGKAVNHEMIVERYPKVEKDQLTAYDICNSKDRVRILQCLCSIRNNII